MWCSYRLWNCRLCLWHWRIVKHKKARKSGKKSRNNYIKDLTHHWPSLEQTAHSYLK
jgi:hypothetical protein